jgi:O-antigen/teichoic acid export membrane protein
MTGLYTRARQMQQLPARNLTFLVGRVAFPTLCSLQDNKDKLKQALQKMTTMVACVHFPLMTCIAVTAAPLITVLLTAKWLPCAALLQVLCIVGALYPLHYIHIAALKAQGRLDKQLPVEITKRCLMLVTLAVTLPFGIKALVAGEAGMSVVAYFLNTFYTVRLLKYRWSEQIRDLIPYILLSAFSGISMICVRLLFDVPAGLMLVVQLCVGCAVYLILCEVFRPSAFVYIKVLTRNQVIKWVAAFRFTGMAKWQEKNEQKKEEFLLSK